MKTNTWIALGAFIFVAAFAATTSFNSSNQKAATLSSDAGDQALVGSNKTAQKSATSATGSVYIVDTYNNRVQKFDSNGNYILQWGSPGSGNGQFNLPYRAVVDSLGNVYVTDLINNRIQKFDSNGNYLLQWGTNGSANGQLSGPQGIAIDSSNNIYVTDSGNSRVQKFTSAGVYITKWGSYGTGNGQFGGGTLGGIAVAPSGNVYVADQVSNRIQAFTSTGTYITKWGSSGSGNGKFNVAQGVAADSSGNIYVTDSGNSRIQKFTSAGVYISDVGSPGSGNGQFSNPWSLAFDASNNIYVPDPGNSRIQKLDINGSYLSQWGSYGTANGQFHGPIGVAVDLLPVLPSVDLQPITLTWNGAGAGFPSNNNPIPHINGGNGYAYFFSTIKNNSTTLPVTLPATTKFVVTVTNKTTGKLFTTAITAITNPVTIPPNGTYDIKLVTPQNPNILKIPATYTTDLSIDTTNLVIESDETNNTISKTLIIQ